MAVDATYQNGLGAPPPYSDEWWRDRLAKELCDRRLGRWWGKPWSPLSPYIRRNRCRPPLELLDEHFRGDPPLPLVAQGWRDAFKEIVRLSQLNVAELCVVAKANRMQLRDFRTAAADDTLGDQVARDVMRFNAMQIVARDVHEYMLELGDGYAIVQPKRSGEKWCRVTAEDPFDTITAEDPATGETLAGLKLFRDEWDASDLAYLYMPGYVRVWRNSASTSMTTRGYRATNGWELDEQKSGNSLPRVAVVRFRNRQGVGEFERHLQSLDRINHYAMNILVIATVQAFRQRALQGAPDYDDDGTKIDYSNAFIAAPGSLWKLPEGATFWESQSTDVTPLRMQLKDEIEHFAAGTSTPLQTLAPDAANQSAEGASLLREEHVYAVEDRRTRASKGWSEVMSLCFLGMGDAERADVTQIEPMWGPAERFSLTDRAQAAFQLKGILPYEAIFTDVLQYPPADVPELQKMRAADVIFENPIVRVTAQAGPGGTGPDFALPEGLAVAKPKSATPPAAGGTPAPANPSPNPNAA
jgi:hypothetical protein